MIKIDTTNPKIKWEYKKSSAHTKYSGRSKSGTCYTSVTYTAKCSDSGSVQSGVKSNPARTEKPTSLGNHSYSATCTDNAGNSVSETSKTYNICKKSTNDNCPYKTCAAAACGTKTCTSSKCCGVTKYTVKKTCTKTKTMVVTKTATGTCPKAATGCMLIHTGAAAGFVPGEHYDCQYRCTKKVKYDCSYTTSKTNTCTKSCCGYYTCATSACGHQSCYHN